MSTPSPQGPARWERRGSRLIAHTAIFDISGVKYHHPVRDTEREFVCLDAPDWVNVVALTPDQQVVLVRQFRYGTNEFSLELPGGVMERGEDAVVAGVRELAEETGFGKGRASLMGSIHPNPAFQGNKFHAVLVEDVEAVHDLDWDPDEEIELSTAPLSEVLAWVAQGKITHSLTLCALLLYLQRRGLGV